MNELKQKIINLSEKAGLYAVIGLFVLSRLIFWISGVRFDTAHTDGLSQFLDKALLKTRLFESIFYLHIQPPFLNLLWGSYLKIFGDNWQIFMALTYFSFGLLMVLGMYLLMGKLKIPVLLRLLILAIFVFSPPSILYENFFFYTYPTALILIWAPLFLFKFLEKFRFQDGLIFFSLLAAAILTRSIYHLIWFVGAFIFLMFFLERKHWRLLFFAAILPFIIIFFWYAKNYLLFQSFSTSSTMPMGLIKVVDLNMSEAERMSLFKQGKTSGLGTVDPFLDLESYRKYITEPKPVGIPVLDNAYKSTGGVNLNSLFNLEVSKQYGKDIANTIKANPLPYLKSIPAAFYIYFLPASEFTYLDTNRAQIKGYEKIFDTVINGRILHNDRRDLKYLGSIDKFFNLGIFIVIEHLILFLLGGYLAYLYFWRPGRVSKAKAATLIFMILTILYVMMAVNLLEIGENNRYRFPIDPYVFVIIGVFLVDFYSYFRIKKQLAN